MLSDELPKQVEKLVDHLRSDRNANLSLTEVASVTEVLIATMRAFFRNIDTSVYRECRDLSDYISSARLEIASLQPMDAEGGRIPRAGLELDAIVMQTEDATNTIMTAAEEIMAADQNDLQAFQSVTNDAVMRIFEACSFQDITGQRISKVVETLAHIEERVKALRDLMGITQDEIQAARDSRDPDPTDEDKALLRGPALEGEGIDQNEVDDLMNDIAPAASAEPQAKAAPSPAPTPMPEPGLPPKPTPATAEAATPEPAPKPAPKPAPAAVKREPAAAKPAPAKAKKEKKAAPAKTEESSGGEDVSQDDIDALFG